MNSFISAARQAASKRSHFIIYYSLVIIPCSLLVLACNHSNDEAAQFFLKGNLQLQKREYREAIRFYSEAIDKKSDFADAYSNRGLAKFQAGDREGALADYTKALAIDPGFAAAHLNRAEVRLETGDATGSLNDLQQIETTYRDSTFYQTRLGDAYVRLNKPAEAQVAYDRAIQLSPKNVEALTNRGALFYQQKAFGPAMQDITLALQVNPDQPEALNNKALLLAHENRFADALPFVEHALRLQTGQPYYLNNKAYLLLMLNRDKEAFPLLQESHRRDNRNAWVHRNLGIYFLHQKKFNEAINSFLQAERIDASVDQLYWYLGQTYAQSGDQTKACEAWRRGELAGDEQATLARKRC